MASSPIGSPAQGPGQRLLGAPAAAWPRTAGLSSGGSTRRSDPRDVLLGQQVFSDDPLPGALSPSGLRVTVGAAAPLLPAPGQSPVPALPALPGMGGGGGGHLYR